MISKLESKLAQDVFGRVWQRFSSQFEEHVLSNEIISWTQFYSFAACGALNRQQARLLAAAWQEQGKVEVRKHGVVFLVEQPAEEKA